MESISLAKRFGKFGSGWFAKNLFGWQSCFFNWQNFVSQAF
jgi:hypothetical protein